MRHPREVSGRELAELPGRWGYAITRQKGSHMRLTTQQSGEHHVTIPEHSPLRIGTLRSILTEVAAHFEITRDELAEQLFGDAP